MLIAAIIFCGTVNVLADNVSYVYYTLDGNKPVKHTDGVADAVPLTSSIKTIGSAEGTWYVVNGTITNTNRIEVSGNAHLILADNCELICEKGITVMDGSRLFIYGQIRNNGYLKVTSPEPGNAGIGGACGVSPDGNNTPKNKWDCGVVNIHGGYLEVHGSDWSAGLGGGWMQRSCKLTMYSGNVEAYGGSDAPGIGNGCFNLLYSKDYLGEDTGWTKIYGGGVIAYGGWCGAGIGGGAGRHVGKIEIFGENLTFVEAYGGDYGAGIGGGAEGEGSKKDGTNTGIFIHGGSVFAYGGLEAAGIGGGGAGEDAGFAGEDGGDITITGGYVKAYGGEGGAGIGGGYEAGLRNLTISGGNVEAIGGEKRLTGGAGIGGGAEAAIRSATVNISGGTVTARGSDDAAGIGFGSEILTTITSSNLYLTVSGGTVYAYGNGEGAGIGGGGNVAKGGSFTITGGTVIAQAGSDCDGEKPSKGSAIGCGYDISDKGNESKCGTFSIGEGVMMHAGSSSSDNRQFTYDERRDGCVWRSYVKLEPCTDHHFSYKVIDETYHAKKCDYCGYTEKNIHDYATGSSVFECVCGYLLGSNYKCEVRLYRKNEGTDVTYNTEPYDSETNPGGYITLDKFMYSEFELPECEQESFEAIFDGWQVLDGFDLPASCIEGDGETIFKEGRAYTVPMKHKVYLCARYKYTYDEQDWIWNRVPGSSPAVYTDAKVILKNNITDEIVTVPATSFTKTSLLEDIVEEDGQDPVYSYSYFYIATAPYEGVDHVDIMEVVVDNIFFLTEEDDNIEIITLKKDVANQNVMLEDRVFYKDGTWNTLCLPFAVDNFTGTPLEGATVKTLTEATFDKSSATLTLTFGGNLSAIEAGKPYIVKWEKPSPYVPYDGNNEETTTDLVNPTFKGVTVTVTEAGRVSGNAADFVGQFAPKIFTVANNTVLYMGSDNKLYFPKPTTVISDDDEQTKIFKYPYINAQRAYFQLERSIVAGDPDSDESQVRAIVLNFDDEMTDIDNGQWSTVNGQSDTWYDLSGRKLSKKPTVKGVYINNGRKVVIK